ncbi:hypothetical protein ACHAW6_009027 [Cyclotella cf. meneghiniana]
MKSTTSYLNPEIIVYRKDDACREQKSWIMSSSSSGSKASRSLFMKPDPTSSFSSLGPKTVVLLAPPFRQMFRFSSTS